MIDRRLASAWADAAQSGNAKRQEAVWTELGVELHRLATGWSSRQRRRLATTDELAVHSFCQTLLDDSKWKLRGADELWRLVAVQTVRIQSAGAQQDVESINSDADLATLMVARCRSLIDELADSDLESVALLKLACRSNAEIAGDMRYTRRTIQRMLQLIRQIWADHLES